MNRGRRTDRVVYVTKEWNLPKPLPGAEWQLDTKFNLADELLRDPDLKTVVKAALEKGAKVVIQRERTSVETRAEGGEEIGKPAKSQKG